MRPGIAKLVFALALALAPGVGEMRPASAQTGQSPSACEGFIPLRNAAQQKALAISTAEKRHADRKELCAVVTRFSLAEGAALKYLEANKTWCGIPDEVVSSAKGNHDKTLKFRNIVCAPAPQPHVPTLSDAIGGPSLDTVKNTKTGHGGTFDTLTGNPLAK
ncbi:MAG: hypothetical protein WBF58_02790 [Xanthobacteraceae bacterium]